jgi:hypothetical protein
MRKSVAWLFRLPSDQFLTLLINLQFIKSSAVILADAIILQKEPIGKVLASINAAGVYNIDYTQTISLIVQQMIQILRRTGTELYPHVKYEVVDRAVSTYINYWRVNSFSRRV